MATTCESLIAQDIIIPCEDQVTKGLEGDGLIINRDDIDFTKSVVEGNTIKTLVLQTGKKAYAIKQEGSKPFTGTKTELTVGTVTPFVGVWIETRNRTKVRQDTIRHTLRGCVD